MVGPPGLPDMLSSGGLDSQQLVGVLFGLEGVVFLASRADLAYCW